MTRVAVQTGSAWTRVAAEGRLLTERPTSVNGLPQVLDELFGAPVEELLVVHGAAAEPSIGPAPRARSVRVVPAAVAALAHYRRSTGVDEECAVVVDLGYGGTEVALVRRGRVAVARRSAVGGRALDIRTGQVLAAKGIRAGPAEIRRVRESLSLLPEVGTGPVEVGADDLHLALAGPLSAVATEVRAAVAAAGPGRSPPVLLAGGVARTPLVAELLDAAEIEDVRVVPRPDAAAVLGALWLVPPTLHRTPGDAGPGSTTAGAVPGGGSWPGTPVGPGAAADPCPRAGTGATAEPDPPDRSASAVWLPPLTPRRIRPSRLVLGALAAVASVAALLGAGAALPSRPAPTAGDLVQYGYAVRLPTGWAHTGGQPERRRSLLAPIAAPDGSDLISVERTPLGYDAGAEPQRVRSELRRVFATAVAAGRPLSAFDDDGHYAGRTVVSYREADASTTVDWYVVLDGDAQLSVGCRHTAAGADLVSAACATVVGTVHRTT